VQLYAAGYSAILVFQKVLHYFLLAPSYSQQGIVKFELEFGLRWLDWHLLGKAVGCVPTTIFMSKNNEGNLWSCKMVKFHLQRLGALAMQCLIFECSKHIQTLSAKYSLSQWAAPTSRRSRVNHT